MQTLNIAEVFATCSKTFLTFQHSKIDMAFQMVVMDVHFTPVLSCVLKG